MVIWYFVPMVANNYCSSFISVPQTGRKGWDYSAAVFILFKEKKMFSMTTSLLQSPRTYDFWAKTEFHDPVVTRKFGKLMGKKEILKKHLAIQTSISASSLFNIANLLLNY
jgi:hypothetical protein